VILSGIHMQPLVALTGSAALEMIGRDNVVGSLDLALARARTLLAAPVVPDSEDATLTH
jgi:hypothetical protein